MKKKREIIVFSEQGDPRQIKTWSNVPFFLVRTLEARGFVVNTVDLSVNDLFQKVVRKIVDFIYPKVSGSEFLNYSRSALYYKIADWKVKRAIKKFPNAELFIFTTFSFSASSFSKKQSILFCDWTIEHYLNYFLDRQPHRAELAVIERQTRLIESAGNVFVLFPSVAETMKQRYKTPSIHYIGNVVNNFKNASPGFINDKIQKKTLLFIGSTKYIDGALRLIEAFAQLKHRFPDMELHIVGIESSDVDGHPEGVFFHGYLDKGNAEQCKSYYELLRRASIFINTTPKWASFSASLEAMYFFTPLIVTRYKEFELTFGEEISFGEYHTTGSDDLQQHIVRLLTADSYPQICIDAHLAAKDHTWEHFVDRMLEITDNKQIAIENTYEPVYSGK